MNCLGCEDAVYQKVNDNFMTALSVNFPKLFNYVYNRFKTAKSKTKNGCTAEIGA